MTIKSLQKTILRLSPAERLHIVENILESLREPDPSVERAWAAESDKRLAAFKRGKTKAVGLEAVKKLLAK